MQRLQRLAPGRSGEAAAAHWVHRKSRGQGVAAQRISTDGLGSAAPHHLPFSNHVMAVGNAAQGCDMLINEENRLPGIFLR
jgi:hypothetical protein